MALTGENFEERRGGRRRLPPLASLEDVAALTGEEITNEVRVNRLLEMASAAVRAWTHQTISFVRGHVVTIPSSGTTLLLLAELPVQNVAHVEIAYGLDWWYENEDDTLEPADPGQSVVDFWGRFSWDSAGRLRRLDGLTWGMPNDPVTVEYSHGWRHIPPDISAVVANKAAVAMESSQANPQNLRSVTIGDYTRAFSDPTATVGILNDGDKEILRRYRAQATAAALGTQ